MNYLKLFKMKPRQRKGQAMLEYGFMLLLISLALIAFVGMIGQQLFDFFTSALNDI